MINPDEGKQQPVICVVGGTGKEGKGLAYRWALAGLQVIIGSRQEEKAQAVVIELNEKYQFSRPIKAMENLAAVKVSDVIVITVPYEFHAGMLKSIKDELPGKLLIDVTVPLVPPKVTKVQMPRAGSAAMEAVQILGENVQVAAAFHNISYERLFGSEKIDCDVLVCGTGKQTREIVLDLVRKAGLTGWDAGPIENSVIPEGLTSILIGINKQFGIQNAGIRITGVDSSAP